MVTVQFAFKSNIAIGLPIKLVGEVSGLRCSGPHAYFTLKDENAQIACNCFSYAKTYLPKNGESVCLFGGVDFYPPGGKLSFNCKKIEPLGKGLLALQLEQLKKKLAEAGYFDESVVLNNAIQTPHPPI